MFQEALADYREAIQSAPDDPLAYSNRGALHLKQGKFRPAIEDYTQVIALTPDDAEALYERGLAYRQLKQKIAALEDLRRAAKLAQQQQKTDLYQRIRDQISKVQTLKP